MMDAALAAGVQFMDNTMFVHNLRQARMKEAMKSIGVVKHVSSAFSIDLGLLEAWARDNIRMKRSLEPLGCLGALEE